MNRYEVRCTMFAGATTALVILASANALAAAPATPRDTSAAAPVVVAQVTAPAGVRSAASSSVEYPAYQRGVREAAAQGNEALRRYIWRTRMIYNFLYRDFANRE
jgi:hypothetical protein